LKYLADENFPGPAVRNLREKGVNILWIRENSPGISDAEVIKIAQSEQRILLTLHEPPA
jgi:predicted nuclease of predicted toxin-antitoxin system